MTITHRVTHSGGFHADELLSSVVLTRLYPQARIVRSREKAWTTPAPDRVIDDVGGDHDPARLIFDHHQKNPPLRDDGQPYSSFGLIWRHFGRDYLGDFDVPERDLEAIHGFRPAGRPGGQRRAVACRAPRGPEPAAATGKPQACLR